MRRIRYFRGLRYSFSSHFSRTRFHFAALQEVVVLVAVVVVAPLVVAHHLRPAPPKSLVDIQFSPPIKRLLCSNMDSQSKPASRFSTLNVFGKFTSKPPRPPPKDKWYSQGSKSVVSLAPSHALSMHTASIASSSHDTLHLQLPQTPFSLSAAHSQSDLTRTMSPVSTHSHATMSSSMTNQSQASEMSSFRRGFSKISSSFGRKPKLFMRSNASRATFDSAIIGGTEDGLEEDMSVSKPYNVQVNIHSFCFIISLFVDIIMAFLASFTCR